MNLFDRIIFKKWSLKEWIQKYLGIKRLYNSSVTHGAELIRNEEMIRNLEMEISLLKRKVDSLEKFYQDVVHIGVDVHFKSPHMILIYTRLGGGQIREIEANFENLRELNQFCQQLKSAFRTDQMTIDLPHGIPRDVMKF
jgi:hypothetical protein